MWLKLVVTSLGRSVSIGQGPTPVSVGNGRPQKHGQFVGKSSENDDEKLITMGLQWDFGGYEWI